MNILKEAWKSNINSYLSDQDILVNTEKRNLILRIRQPQLKDGCERLCCCPLKNWMEFMNIWNYNLLCTSPCFIKSLPHVSLTFFAFPGSVRRQKNKITLILCDSMEALWFMSIAIFCDKLSIFKVYGQEITEKMNT